jgi:hypothetical protein
MEKYTMGWRNTRWDGEIHNGMEKYMMKWGNTRWDGKIHDRMKKCMMGKEVTMTGQRSHEDAKPMSFSLEAALALCPGARRGSWPASPVACQSGTDSVLKLLLRQARPQMVSDVEQHPADLVGQVSVEQSALFHRAFLCLLRAARRNQCAIQSSLSSSIVHLFIRGSFP